MISFLKAHLLNVIDYICMINYEAEILSITIVTYKYAFPSYKKKSLISIVNVFINKVKYCGKFHTFVTN